MTGQKNSEPGDRLADEAWSPTHRHLKSGRKYQVLMRGQDSDKGVEVVIYRGVGGHVWVREAAEFDDGRFEPISPART
jgi:hypothetical protein